LVVGQDKGIVTIAGDAEDANALVVTAGDIVITDGDLVLTAGDAEFGEDVTVTGISYLNGGGDFNDADFTSVDKLEGVDNAVYIDLGADTMIDITADGYVEVNSPYVQLDTDGAILKLGDDGDVTLTHVADAGLTLNSGMYLGRSIDLIVPQSKTYEADDDSETIGTDLTSSVVLVTGDNDSSDETVDLQDGTVAGQMITFITVALVDDTDDAFILDVETDSTCTGCPTSGIFTLETVGSSVTLYWTGSFWHYCGSVVGE